MTDDLSSLTDDALRDEVTTWAGRVAAGEARLLLLIGELDARGAWAQHGLKSCAHWLTWRAGLGPNAARERVRVARMLRELPMTTVAFSEGRLSWSQVRAITRVASPSTDEQYAELARGMTAAQLERLCQGVRRAQKPDEDAADPEAASWRMRPRVRYDEDGTMVLTFRLPAEKGAVVLAALEEAAEQASVSAETPATIADGLVEVCEKVVTGAPTRRARRRLKVCVDPLSGWSRLSDGELLPPGTVPAPVVDDELSRRRPACANVARAMSRHDRGRRERDVPPALRALLGQVDGERCRFPGCWSTRFLHAHHVQPWSEGGPTDLANLVLTCSFHHHVVHDQGYILTLHQDRRITWTAPNGGTEWARPGGPWEPLESLDAQRFITATTLPPAWDGSPLNLDYAVWALMHAAA